MVFFFVDESPLNTGLAVAGAEGAVDLPGNLMAARVEGGRDGSKSSNTHDDGFRVEIFNFAEVGADEWEACGSE